VGARRPNGNSQPPARFVAEFRYRFERILVVVEKRAQARQQSLDGLARSDASRAALATLLATIGDVTQSDCDYCRRAEADDRVQRDRRREEGKPQAENAERPEYGGEGPQSYSGEAHRIHFNTPIFRRNSASKAKKLRSTCFYA